MAALEAQGSAYTDALTLAEAGRYGEAQAVFQSLGDYADAPALAENCRRMAEAPEE